MSSNYNDLADAIVKFVYRALNRGDAPVAKVYMAVFVAANSLDANLSQIRFPDGSVVDYIPKLTSHVFTANDVVMVITGPAVPMHILGLSLGDITVAQQ